MNKSAKSSKPQSLQQLHLASLTPHSKQQQKISPTPPPQVISKQPSTSLQTPSSHLERLQRCSPAGRPQSSLDHPAVVATVSGHGSKSTPPLPPPPPQQPSSTSVLPHSSDQITESRSASAQPTASFSHSSQNRPAIGSGAKRVPLSRPSSAGLPATSHQLPQSTYVDFLSAMKGEEEEEEEKEEPEPLRVSDFSLYSDRLDYEYRPGDCVSGKLRLIVESGLLPLRRLMVTFRGIASVRFTEREYQSSSQHERHFEDVNYWADHSILEYTCHPRLPEIKLLPPGEHHLPFKFILPRSAIPSSFESHYGYVRYWLSGELRPRSKPQSLDEAYERITDDFEVVVTAPPTLPITEQLRSINAERVKEMGCCSCLSRNPGFIQVRANLTHQAQQRGSCVQINLFIVNRSSKLITPKATLKEKQEFRAQSKSKVLEHELVGCFGTSVKPGESVFQSILLPLSLELPVIHNCPIIVITYRIKIGIEIPRAFDMYFHLPVLLTDDPILDSEL